MIGFHQRPGLGDMKVSENASIVENTTFSLMPKFLISQGLAENNFGINFIFCEVNYSMGQISQGFEHSKAAKIISFRICSGD